MRSLIPLYELVTRCGDLVPGDYRRGDSSHHAVKYDLVTRYTSVVGRGQDPAGGHYSKLKVRQIDGKDTIPRH